jgi:hypothetical protein
MSMSSAAEAITHGLLTLNCSVVLCGMNVLDIHVIIASGPEALVIQIIGLTQLLAPTTFNRKATLS